MSVVGVEDGRDRGILKIVTACSDSNLQALQFGVNGVLWPFWVSGRVQLQFG